MSDLGRIRWHCRRGLLELDLVLTKFLDTRFESLTALQKESFIRLINYADNDLWDLIGRKAQSNDPQIEEIIRLFD
jgi:antitoxin CptB